MSTRPASDIPADPPVVASVGPLPDDEWPPDELLAGRAADIPLAANG